MLSVTQGECRYAECRVAQFTVVTYGNIEKLCTHVRFAWAVHACCGQCMHPVAVHACCGQCMHAVAVPANEAIACMLAMQC